MMTNHRQPIRTYQRKTAKKPINISLAPSVILNEKYHVETNCFTNNEICNHSITYDPFETTFDRLAKGAVVPPLPLDVNRNNSWNSSSNSDNNTTNLVKSPEHIACNLFTCNDTSGLTHENVKRIRKCKKSQKYKIEVIPEPVYKKTKIISKDEIQSRVKVQARKVQTNVQRQKIIQYKLKKSSCKFNERTYCSGTTSDLKNAIHKDILCDYNNKQLSQSAFKMSKDTTIISQTTSNRANDSITTFKHMLNYNKKIKPCFVKLDIHAVQNWYILNREKTMRNKKNIKHSCKRILQTNKNTFKINNIILQSISIDHNVSETLKHTPIKPCSVVLYDVFKNWKKKNEKSKKDSIDAANETNASYLIFRHNLSKIASRSNIDIDNAISGKERNKAYVIKDNFIKMKRLKIEKLIEKKMKAHILNEKEKYVVSSTPISKHIKPSAYPILSPIKSIHDILNSRYENSAIIGKENVPIGIFPGRKDSTRSFTSECCKIDIRDMQEQQTQVLLPSQKLSIATDIGVKVETISSNKDMHLALMQQHNAKSDKITEFPLFLNISASTDRSRSLFDDTTRNCNYSTEDVIGNNTQKKYTIDALENKSAEISNVATSLHLYTDLSLKQKEKLLMNNVYTDLSSRYITSPKISIPIKTEIPEDLNDIGRIKQIYKGQKKRCTEMNSTEIVCKSSKNETVDDNKYSSLSTSRDKLSTTVIDIHALFTNFQDSIRITKRMRYSKWHPRISSISKSLSNKSMLSNNEVFHYVVTGDCSNIQSIANNFEHSRNAINYPNSFNYPKLLDDVTQQRYSNDTDMQVLRSVFLKPGKCWTRSLSILNNVNPGSNLDKLCAGKGKKWRHSVRNILDMQKQGTFCLKKNQDDTKIFGGLDTSTISSLGDNRCKTFDSANHSKFSKRISVRVVPNNNISIKCDVKDAPFLEAFGITAENSFLKLNTLCEKKISIHNVEYDDKDRIFESHLTTAKDIILQRCSQKHYLPFSESFPDSYLEHCRKIGEGVYGEVFLCERDGEKSVIKIIPIEGEELVNGEPQKKFSEILSEIVIAEELYNLRLHPTYRTNAFVEVRSIKCIIGRYPEKLIKLWNIYDDDKTSDNDCPSMFEDHQLYIALELGHGGEDLEAFVFQTAQEAYALFLQTALALAVAEEAFEFEHRDLHWGNVLISRTKEPYVYYNLNGKEIKIRSNNVKVSIIDYTLSRMLYHGCCIYNDLALDPALFIAHGEYQFEIYRLMRDKIQNNWWKFEPYTNILWLHYTLDKMITAVRYKKKNLKVHKQAINKLKELKDTILNYDSAYNFVNNCSSVM